MFIYSEKNNLYHEFINSYMMLMITCKNKLFPFLRFQGVNGELGMEGRLGPPGPFVS